MLINAPAALQAVDVFGNNANHIVKILMIFVALIYVKFSQLFLHKY